MRNSFPKIIIATLFGIVFLLGGGIATASAAVQPTAIEQATSLLGNGMSCDIFAPGSCIKKLPMYGFMVLSYFIYILTAGVLALSGYIFDAIITLSIDRTFILKPFIDSTWTILRDFSNMAFIFVLLYTGIQTILGLGNWRKTVIQVIIIALLINFSLFFTKVVIDAGNILAVGIYESIGVVKIDSTHTKPVVGGLAERDLSSAITTLFGPQKILGAVGTIDSPYLVFAIFIIGAVINVLAAWAFFKVALIFIGRIIGFWFLMIISPFAFISTTFPKGNVFQQWLDNLLGLSFVAPVFLFFLYLIMQVVSNGDLLSTLGKPSGAGIAEFSFDVIFIPVIMVIFIYMALDKAVSVSKDMAGGFGKLGSDMGGMVMGLAGGAVIGGAAMAGKGVGGKLAAKAFEGGTMQRWAASEKTGLLGAAQRNLGMRGTMALDTARNASWDARNVGLIGKGIKATGVDMGKGGKVGYVQGQKDWIKEQKKKASLMEVTKEEEAVVIDKVTKPEQENVKRTEDNRQIYETRVHEATRLKKEAEEAAKISATGQRVTSATANVATQKTAAEKANADLESLKQSTLATEDMKINAEREAQKAAQALKGAENELSAATVAHAASGEVEKIKTATEFLASADSDYKKAEEASKQAVATLEATKKGAVKTENERRRGAYAEQVTQGVPTSTVARETGTTHGTENLSKARKKKIATIRAGKSEEDEKKEAEAALLKEIAKKIKEAEGGDH